MTATIVAGADGESRPLRQTLQELYEHVGSLSPGQMVQEARNPESRWYPELNPLFDWDNESAGEKFRLVQAALYIRKCQITVIVEEEKTIRARAFVLDPAAGRGEYEPIEQALRGGNRAVVMQQAIRELAAFRRKYGNLVDLDAVWNAAIP